MIIICEKCSTKFNVPDSAIGPSGRNVKCSSCAHTWKVGGDTTEEAKMEPVPVEVKAEAAPQMTVEPAPKPAPEAAPQPPVAEGSKEAAPANAGEIKAAPRRYAAPATSLYQKSFVYYGSMLAACLAFFFFIGLFFVFHRQGIVHKVPALQAMYDQISLYNNDGLKLELVDCTIREPESAKSDGTEVEIEVDVSILNTSDKDQKLGSVRFSIYDIERNFIGNHVMHVDQVIASNKNTKIDGRLNRVPKNSFFVAIDFGNDIDLKILTPNKLHKLG